MVIWWINGANPLVPAIGGAIAGLVLVVIAAFKPHPLFSSGYALFEGCLLEESLPFFEAKYPGL
jgi:uncharacterized YccA/Bax inhibitor family protein